MSGRCCCVYWLHLPEYTDLASQGYVGKSVNTAVRWKAHRKSKAFPAAYVETILFEGTEQECLRREHELRPRAGIGWNRIPGGGQPPSQKGKKQGSRVFSDEHRRNLSVAHLGHTPWNKGVSYPLSEKQWTAMRNPEVRRRISIAKLTQPSCKRVEINGVKFDSINAAARSLGIPKTTLRKRLKREAA